MQPANTALVVDPPGRAQRKGGGGGGGLPPSATKVIPHLKNAGTERGITEPTATSSALLRAASLTLHLTRYSELLQEKLKEHGSNAYKDTSEWRCGRGCGCGFGTHCIPVRKGGGNLLVLYSDDRRGGKAAAEKAPTTTA